MPCDLSELAFSGAKTALPGEKLGNNSRTIIIIVAVLVVILLVVIVVIIIIRKKSKLKKCVTILLEIDNPPF